MKEFELKSIAELTQIAKGADRTIAELAIREIAKRENSRRPKMFRRLMVRDYGLSTS